MLAVKGGTSKLLSRTPVNGSVSPPDLNQAVRYASSYVWPDATCNELSFLQGSKPDLPMPPCSGWQQNTALWRGIRVFI